jgi:hypothetical protein
MKKQIVALAIGLSCALPSIADSTPELFVMINSGTPQTQGMAMVLASQAMEQKSSVRVLLCSEGGQLAVKGKEGIVLKPRDRVPGRGVRGTQEVMDSGMVGMPVRLSRRTG